MQQFILITNKSFNEQEDDEKKDEKL